MPSSFSILQPGNSFNTIEESTDPQQLQKALDYYHSNLDSATNLQNNIPLFLDTNVLLRGYSISPDRRKLLYDFFEKHQAQIIITKQVQEEFDRNRAAELEAFAYAPEAQISDLSDALAGLMLDLESNADHDGVNLEDSSDNADELMDIYNGFKKIDNLAGAEKEFLIREFNLKKSEKIDFEKQQTKDREPPTKHLFPGMGDIIAKPTYPYGDYFLFHEMLKFSVEQNKDVAFLTFDVAKADWLQQNKQAHQHYIYKSYALNKKAIFILDANNFLENKFKTSFEGLVVMEEKKIQNYVIKSELEKELVLLFNRLEKTLRRIARKSDLEAGEDISSKRLLDDLNLEEIISDTQYYELKGIWSVRDELVNGEVELIRRRYGEAELGEILIVVKESLRVIGRL